MTARSFDTFRTSVNADHATGNIGNWCVVGGFDERAYLVTLQQSADEKEPRVRAGCRYFTLRGARSHWTSKRRNCDHRTRRTSRQILALIGSAVEQAKRRGFLSQKIKFNSTPRKFGT